MTTASRLLSKVKQCWVSSMVGDHVGIPGVIILFSFLLQVECLGRLIPFFWMVDCIGVWKWLIWAVNINSASFTGDYCR